MGVKRGKIMQSCQAREIMRQASQARENHAIMSSAGNYATGQSSSGKSCNHVKSGKIMQRLPSAAKSCNGCQARENHATGAKREKIMQRAAQARESNLGRQLTLWFRIRLSTLHKSSIFLPVTAVAVDSSFRLSCSPRSLFNSSISSSVSGPGIQSNGEYHRTKSSNKQPGFAA